MAIFKQLKFVIVARAEAVHIGILQCGIPTTVTKELEQPCHYRSQQYVLE